MKPHIFSAARNGIRKPVSVAKFLNRNALRTACKDEWTPRLARLLLSMVFNGPDAVARLGTQQVRKPRGRLVASPEKIRRTAESLVDERMLTGTLLSREQLLKRYTARPKFKEERSSVEPKRRSRKKRKKPIEHDQSRSVLVDPNRSTALLPNKTDHELLGLWRNLIRYYDKQPNECEVALARVQAEWQRRAAATDAAFAWPSTLAVGGDGRLDGSGWLTDGMLAALGYRVGAMQGASLQERRLILKGVFIGPLPPVGSFAYYESWGQARSSRRLEKLAETIAAFVRNAKRKSSDMSAAISDWEADLDFLFHEYYVGYFRFGWPSVSLEGK